MPKAYQQNYKTMKKMLQTRTCKTKPKPEKSQNRPQTTTYLLHVSWHEADCLDLLVQVLMH